MHCQQDLNCRNNTSIICNCHFLPLFLFLFESLPLEGYVALSDTHVIILYDVSVIRVFVLLKYMLGAELTR
jgi:hypothetical protein